MVMIWILLFLALGFRVVTTTGKMYNSMWAYRGSHPDEFKKDGFFAFSRNDQMTFMKILIRRKYRRDDPLISILEHARSVFVTNLIIGIAFFFVSAWVFWSINMQGAH